MYLPIIIAAHSTASNNRPILAHHARFTHEFTATARRHYLTHANCRTPLAPSVPRPIFDLRHTPTIPVRTPLIAFIYHTPSLSPHEATRHLVRTTDPSPALSIRSSWPTLLRFPPPHLFLKPPPSPRMSPHNFIFAQCLRPPPQTSAHPPSVSL